MFHFVIYSKNLQESDLDELTPEVLRAVQDEHMFEFFEQLTTNENYIQALFPGKHDDYKNRITTNSVDSTITKIYTDNEWNMPKEGDVEFIKKLFTLMFIPPTKSLDFDPIYQVRSGPCNFPIATTSDGKTSTEQTIMRQMAHFLTGKYTHNRITIKKNKPIGRILQAKNTTPHPSVEEIMGNRLHKITPAEIQHARQITRWQYFLVERQAQMKQSKLPH